MITHSYTQLVLETSFPFCFRLHFLGLPGRKRTTNETFVCSFPFMQTAQNPGSETASPGHLKFEVQNGRWLPAPFFVRFRIVFVGVSALAAGHCVVCSIVFVSFPLFVFVSFPLFVFVSFPLAGRTGRKLKQNAPNPKRWKLNKHGNVVSVTN